MNGAVVGTRVGVAAGAILVATISVGVYWSTAYPTINWWDSGQYSLAASTMGVVGPPGSLLLTLLGWVVTRFSDGASTAHTLNLFAGALAATSATLVYAVALRALRLVGVGTMSYAAIGASLGALAFAFGNTAWEYATQFTPYVLSAVFTGLILLAMLRWWETADDPSAWRYIALLGLLFGLDFSVHRTNALLMPAVLAWIAIRNPAALRLRRTWIAGLGSLASGLVVHLLLIPIARTTRSPLVWNDPTDLSRFWSYISLERIGGGFLLGVFPRKSNVVTEQTADLLRTLGDNFFHWNGPAGAFSMFSGVVGLYGLAALWRRDRRFGMAFSIVLFLQAFLTVLYFNIPADFFRSLDRHYLPVLVTFGVAIACGLGILLQDAALRFQGRRLVTISFVLLVSLVPAAALMDGWRSQDASRRHFAGDYARNVLQSLPPNAIYFTIGDNDTFPTLYMQAVEGVRRDVQLVNLSLANAPEYIAGLLRQDPAFPLSMTREQHRLAARGAWPDTSIALPVVGDAARLALDADSLVPREIVLRPRPQYGGPNMTPGEIVLLDLVRTNAWKRPLTFAITASPDRGWLKPYARLDGLFWRVVPVREPRVDPERLRTVLWKNAYRGYADSSVVIDDVSRTIGVRYLEVFDTLLEAQEARGNSGARCRAEKSRLMAAVPPARLDLPPEFIEKLTSRCRG